MPSFSITIDDKKTIIDIPLYKNGSVDYGWLYSRLGKEKIRELSLDPEFLQGDNGWGLIALLSDNLWLTTLNGFIPRLDRKRWSRCVMQQLERNRQLKEVCEVLDLFSTQIPQENDLPLIQRAAVLAVDLYYASTCYLTSGRWRSAYNETSELLCERKRLRENMIIGSVTMFLKAMLPNLTWQVDSLLRCFPADTKEIQQLYAEYFERIYVAEYESKQSAFKALLKASRLFFDANNKLVAFSDEKALIRDVYLLTAINVNIEIANLKALTLEDRMLSWQRFIEEFGKKEGDYSRSEKANKKIKSCMQILKIYQKEWLQGNKKIISESTFVVRNIMSRRTGNM